MTLYGLSRAVYRAARLQSATRNPGRYAGNRAKSKLMSSLGVWGLWRKWWRA